MRKKEIFGVLLLIIGVSGFYLSSRGVDPETKYLIATRDFSPGEFVATSDFRGVAIDLRDAAAGYINAEANFSSRRVLRKIIHGELIPRDALSKNRIQETRGKVAFTLSNTKTPQSLKKGAIVDIYFFKVPDQGIAGEKVKLLKVFESISIFTVEKNDGQFNGEIRVTVLLQPEQISEFLTLLLGNEMQLVQGIIDDY